MNAIRFKTILAVCTFAACLATTYSSQAQVCLKGDINLDGTVNMADWLPMADLLVEGRYQCEGDNGDGQIDFLDLAGIQQIILDQQAAAFTDTSTDGDGRGDFFWSTANLNEGAVNGPLDVSLLPGESVTLYLYYSTNGPSNSDIRIGYSINVATSQSGIVEFTEAETLNYSFLSGALSRWGYPRGNLGGDDGVWGTQAQSVQSDLVIGLTAMTLLSADTGFSAAFASVDLGYDSQAQAFLCGRIQIEAIAPGTIELAAGPNAVGIADEYDLLQPVFARANIIIPSVDPAVLVGDVNKDGLQNFFDIAPFIAVLASDEYQVEADCNGDSYVDFFDIPFFVDALAGN